MKSKLRIHPQFKTAIRLSVEKNIGTKPTTLKIFRVKVVKIGFVGYFGIEQQFGPAAIQKTKFWLKSQSLC